MQGAQIPLCGPEVWFERAMAEHKDDVIREAAALAGGRPGR